VRTAELSRLAGTVLRPQPLAPAEPVATTPTTRPTTATTPTTRPTTATTATLTPRASANSRAAKTRAIPAAAPDTPLPEDTAAGEKAATTPSGKRRKAASVASTGPATGKTGGSRK